MSFPPPLPNSAMFQAFAQGVPPMPPFPIPMAGIPVPLVPPPGPLPMGVTVPAGVASISAPPVRKQNSGIIAAPPVMQLSNNVLMYPPPMSQHMHQHQGKPYQDYGKKCQNTITVFVGNITEKASDMLIRQLLSKCGAVTHWKRVQGPNGKLQAFGFCEYCDAEAAMRAIRLLHDFEIADKKLIVRVDAKTQEKLDEYTKSKNSNSSKESKNDTDSSQKAEEELDNFTRDEDRKVKSQLILVLKEHEIELTKDQPESMVNKGNKRGPSAPNNKVQNENLNELEIEDEKRNLIHREIDRFRDTYKKYDEEKEEEKKKRDDDRPRRRDDDRKSKRSGDRDRDRDRDRRGGDKERDRDREKQRSSSPETFNRSKSPTDEEDAAAKRRKDKITREKELAYQRRLRDWESREKRKAKEYERESINEARIKEEEEIEKQKLKQFLQDYDDDKHDQKYYKGRNMQKRMAERRKEIVQDDCEHEQERKELEALKQKLAEEGHPDPDSEVRKRLNVTESPNNINDQIKLLMSEARNNAIFDNDEDSHDSSSNMAVKTFGFQGMKIAAGDVAPSSQPHPNGGGPSSFPLEVANDNSNHSAPMSSSVDAKRKRLMVSDVFNTNEDDEASVQNGKKRRPPPNSLLEDSNTDSNLSGNSSKPVGVNSSSQLSQEEKRRQVKIIIDKIPTSKEELFNYNIEWDRLDNSLMEKRIKPWINKKISDYIGEEEKTLLEFICQKLQTKCSAQCLLDNVAMVLDEEAQVFVVKLWRLLIYEIEARKIGLAK